MNFKSSSRAADVRSPRIILCCAKRPRVHRIRRRRIRMAGLEAFRKKRCSRGRNGFIVRMLDTLNASTMSRDTRGPENRTYPRIRKIINSFSPARFKNSQSCEEEKRLAEPIRRSGTVINRSISSYKSKISHGARDRLIVLSLVLHALQPVALFLLLIYPRSLIAARWRLNSVDISRGPSERNGIIVFGDLSASRWLLATDANFSF